MRFYLWLFAATCIALPPSVSFGQILAGGVPSVDDIRLYAWYDGAEFIGFDGIAETPVWPNRQGDEDRAIWSGFGPSDESAANVITLDNGLPGAEYIDVVTWTDEDRFGTIEDGFTIFVTAAVRDPNHAYFFTGNQSGGGPEANANHDTVEFDVWTMKGDLDRIATTEVVVDELQVHAFTFREDGVALHHINGELVGEGEVGVGSPDGRSLQGFVLGGRQNGGQRATVDFAEVLIYEVDLSDADRGLVESYLTGKHFVTGGVVGDFDNDGALTAADIDLLTTAIAAGEMDARFDVDASGAVDSGDRLAWVSDVANTYVGDANLDGEFNSGDFVVVFTAGEYEDELAGNSTWASGDWDGNGDFDSSDFVAAFAEGSYEIGPRAATAVSVVPEPSTGLLTLIGFTILSARRRYHDRRRTGRHR